MNELIKVEGRTVGRESVQTVNARELHGFLGVRSEFRNWIKNRIEDFGFTEGSDFMTSVSFYRGGERKDYHLTMDMAKELAMVERNEKGKQARQYFIECERRLLKATPAIPQSLPEALRLAADLAEQNGKQALLIEQQKPADASSVPPLTPMLSFCGNFGGPFAAIPHTEELPLSCWLVRKP